MGDKLKSFLVLLVFTLCFSFLSASPFGYDYLDHPSTGTQIINGSNYSINVNNSELWQGYTPQTYNQTFISWIPSWVTDNFYPNSNPNNYINSSNNLWTDNGDGTISPSTISNVPKAHGYTLINATQSEFNYLTLNPASDYGFGHVGTGGGGAYYGNGFFFTNTNTGNRMLGAVINGDTFFFSGDVFSNKISMTMSEDGTYDYIANGSVGVGILNANNQVNTNIVSANIIYSNTSLYSPNIYANETSISIGNVGVITATEINLGSGYLTNSECEIKGYVYATKSGTWSSSGSEFDFFEDATSTSYDLSLTWDAVDGATGYRVYLDMDDCYSGGSGGSVWLPEVATNYYIYDACVGMYDCFTDTATFSYPPTPTSLTTGGNIDAYHIFADTIETNTLNIIGGMNTTTFTADQMNSDKLAVNNISALSGSYVTFNNQIKVASRINMGRVLGGVSQALDIYGTIGNGIIPSIWMVGDNGVTTSYNMYSYGATGDNSFNLHRWYGNTTTGAAVPDNTNIGSFNFYASTNPASSQAMGGFLATSRNVSTTYYGEMNFYARDNNANIADTKSYIQLGYNTTNGNFFKPKTNAFVDLGTSTEKWKNGFFSGNITATNFNGNWNGSSAYVSYTRAIGNVDLNGKNLTNVSRLDVGGFIVNGTPVGNQSISKFYNKNAGTTTSSIDFDSNDNGGMVYRFYRNGAYAGGVGTGGAGTFFNTASTVHYWYVGGEGTPSATFLGRWNANGLGIGVPISDTGGGNVHIHGTTPYFHITDATTGTAAADGVKISLDASQNLIINNQENNSIITYTNNTERMRVTANGMVGINKTVPVFNLDINGVFGVTSNAYITGSAYNFWIFNSTEKSNGFAQRTNLYNASVINAITSRDASNNIAMYQNILEYQQSDPSVTSRSVTGYSTSMTCRAETNATGIQANLSSCIAFENTVTGGSTGRIVNLASTSSKLSIADQQVWTNVKLNQVTGYLWNGNITNWYGYYIDSSVSNIGTTGNLLGGMYGIYVSSLNTTKASAGSLGRPYSLYLAGTEDRNYIGGDLGIGNTPLANIGTTIFAKNQNYTNLVLRVASNPLVDSLVIQNSSGYNFTRVDSNGTIFARGLNIGNSSGNFTIDSSGDLRLIGEATQWDDISVAISGSKTETAKPPLFDETQMAYYFEDVGAGNEEYVFGAFEMPHGWKLGTNLHCHIHTHPSSTNVGNATFELSYTWTNIGAVEGSPTAINLNVSYNGTANLVQIPEWQEINGTGKTLSSVIEFRLRRMSAAASDTFTGNAYVDNIGCHYEIDSFGSNQELNK